MNFGICFIIMLDIKLADSIILSIMYFNIVHTVLLGATEFVLHWFC